MSDIKRNKLWCGVWFWTALPVIRVLGSGDEAFFLIHGGGECGDGRVFSKWCCVDGAGSPVETFPLIYEILRRVIQRAQSATDPLRLNTDTLPRWPQSPFTLYPSSLPTPEESSTMVSDSITPPHTPPRVAFDPPLFLQRRTAVIDLLHKVHKLPRFNGKLRSLLDVGCGLECLLLGSLIALNDDLPLEQVTGIDLDDGLMDQMLVDSLGPNGQYVGDEGRWRKFGLTILHGE